MRTQQDQRSSNYPTSNILDLLTRDDRLNSLGPMDELAVRVLTTSSDRRSIVHLMLEACKQNRRFEAHRSPIGGLRLSVRK